MWLAVRCPQLALEALLVSDPSNEKQPNNPSKNQLSDHQAFAVSQNNRIICVNQQAKALGIQINQSLSSVHALSDTIQIFERHINQEQQCLNNLALLLYAYSPKVTIKNPHSLLVEIGCSLKLFLGLENLLLRIQQDLSQQPITVLLAIGDTPKSAQLLSFQSLENSLSCCEPNTKKMSKEKIQKQIATIPISLLELQPKTLEKIHSVGISSIGELKKLPSSSLQKRFGKELSFTLAQLNGDMPDLQTYFLPPENFSQQLEFMQPVHHRLALLFPIKRLLSDLCRFLTLKQKYCQQLRWTLTDSEKNSLGFDVLLSDNQVSLAVYLELTQLNLERFSLHAPIEKIAVKTGPLTDLNLDSQDLFEQATDFKQDPSFINKVKAKLGKDSCYQPQAQKQHLPELANNQLADPQLIGTNLNIIEKDKNIQNQSNPLYRPSWLFEKPQRIGFNQSKLIWQGELQIISSVERVAANWWSQKEARDYYVAEHDNGSLYWVFFDKLQQQWFLQGIYG